MSRTEVIGDCTPVSFVNDEVTVTIYCIKPDTCTDPVYVGSTHQKLRHRIRAHVLNAQKGSAIPLHAWIRERVSAGFVVEVLERLNGLERRHEREKYWVSQFNGLLNVTDGGPGMSGHRFAGTDHATRIADGLKTGDTFTCAACGSEFWRKRTEISKGNNKFCSRACYANSLRGISRPVPARLTESGVLAAALEKRARTHCKRGHPLSGENLFVTSSGARGCKECRRLHKRAYLERCAHA